MIPITLFKKFSSLACIMSIKVINMTRYSSKSYELRDILRGTRNLSFVLRRSLLRTFETIWILVITLECSNITGSKSIRRERKMRPMELSGVNFSTHGSESECSCFDQVLCVSVCDELQSHNFV